MYLIREMYSEKTCFILESVGVEIFPFAFHKCERLMLLLNNITYLWNENSFFFHEESGEQPPWRVT